MHLIRTQLSGLLIIPLSIGVNYLVGRSIDRAQKQGKSGVWSLRLGIFFNLLLLGIAKYTFFAVENLNWILGSLGQSAIKIEPFGLLLGISFFTFHAISYLVDIYSGRAAAQKDVVNYGLYIALFPQLIAGPIIRYRDIADQLTPYLEALDLFHASDPLLAAPKGSIVVPETAEPLGDFRIPGLFDRRTDERGLDGIARKLQFCFGQRLDEIRGGECHGFNNCIGRANVVSMNPWAN